MSSSPTDGRDATSPPRAASETRPAAPAPEPGHSFHINPLLGGLVDEQSRHAPHPHAAPAAPATPDPAALAHSGHTFHVNPLLGGLVDEQRPHAPDHHAALNHGESESLGKSIALHRLDESIREGHADEEHAGANKPPRR